ncbi:ion transporter [Eggerthellaceae bacterium 3-80]
MTNRKNKQSRGSGRIRHTIHSAHVSLSKREAFYALENPHAAKPFAKFIGYFLFVLIILNAIVVFLSAQPGLDPVTSNVIDIFFAFSAICFAIEYFARIWIADLAYGNCTPTQARIRYIFSPLGLVDLLAFLPSMIAWFIPLNEALRTTIDLVRLVRVIKISRYMRGLRTIGRVISMRKHEISAAFMVIMLLILIASVLMYEAEHDAQPEKFNSLFTGMYWAVTTITGTGYGDLVPITALGRFIGSVIMLLSVAVVAIPGGIFSAGFVAEYQNANVRKIERKLDRNGKQQQKVSQQDTSDSQDAKSADADLGAFDDNDADDEADTD